MKIIVIDFYALFSMRLCSMQRAHDSEIELLTSTLGFPGISNETRPAGTIQTEAMAVSTTPKNAENQAGTFGKNCRIKLTTAIRRKRGP